MTDIDNIIGKTYNKLTVVARARNKDAAAVWKCKCECGKTCEVLGKHIRAGMVKSCGCLLLERNKRLGNMSRVHGMRHTRIYKVWCDMKARCNNKSRKDFAYYGGRGITHDPRWDEFELFYLDMGDPKPGESLDRIDPDGNYYKSNCRWATKLEQANNTRRNHYLTYQGKTQSISQWARETGIHKSTISRRVSAGLTIEKVMSRQSRCTPERVLKSIENHEAAQAI